PGPPAARDRGRRALSVESDELVVLLHPAAERLAVASPVLERPGEHWLDGMRPHEVLQLLDEGVDGQRRRRTLEGVEVEEVAGVRGRGRRARLSQRRGHAAPYQDDAR